MKDKVNTLTHLSFAILSIPVTILLLLFKAKDAIGYLAFSVFGLSLLALYTASAVYHGANVSEQTRRRLKKWDHMMIFVLIAGTYTPLCLLTLRDDWGLVLLSATWGLSLMGIVMKALWIDAPRWLGTLVYVLVGWASMAAWIPMTRSMAFFGRVWLLLGGFFYTVGALIYALKRPRFLSRIFGFHELFHVFVMVGTACHVVMMFAYVW